MVQISPQNAAWTTEALSCMEYDEVQRFRSAYQLQAKFERFEGAFDGPMLHLIATFATTDKPDPMPAAQAESVLRDVHLCMAHLMAAKGLAGDVNKVY